MSAYQLSGPRQNATPSRPLFLHTVTAVLATLSGAPTSFFFFSTSRSWWMLEILRSSPSRLRMLHRCSIGFRSGDMLASPSPLTLSFYSKVVVILEVCLGSLSCWNTALQPCFQINLSWSHQTKDMVQVVHVLSLLVFSKLFADSLVHHL